MISTMREIIVVGAGGYIGTRLLSQFVRENVDWVTGFDLGIFGAKRITPVHIKDVADIPEHRFANAVVVYLASFHREPENMDNPKHWADRYKYLMVEMPLRLSLCCHQLIYVSSMRALTDRDSLYGKTKAMAERTLISRSNVRMVRFGTVWGWFSETLPNRPNTAVNFALSRKRFEGNHWEAFTTHASDAINYLYETAMTASHPENSPARLVTADIINITDLPIPLVSEDIRMLLMRGHLNKALQQVFNAELQIMPKAFDVDDDHKAAARLQTYYRMETVDATQDAD